MSEKEIEKPDWRPDWHPIEREYINETGKLPYQKNDKNLSKDFKKWLNIRFEKERQKEKLKNINVK